jgi:hypothetical protein
MSSPENVRGEKDSYEGEPAREREEGMPRMIELAAAAKTSNSTNTQKVDNRISSNSLLWSPTQ